MYESPVYCNICGEEMERQWPYDEDEFECPECGNCASVISGKVIYKHEDDSTLQGSVFGDDLDADHSFARRVIAALMKH